MSGLAGTPKFLRIALRVAIETLHFHKAQTGLFLMSTLFHIKGTPMSTHANCPRMQGKSNLMQCYIKGKENRKKNTRKYPCKPQFYHIKVGFELGSKFHEHVSMKSCF